MKNNTYEIAVEGEEKTAVDDSNNKSENSKQHEFPTGQVYPEGFLSKPKKANKRRSLSDDAGAQIGSNDLDEEQPEASDNAVVITTERQSRVKKAPKRLISEDIVTHVPSKQQHVLLNNIFGIESTEIAPKKTVGVSVGKEDLVKVLEQMQDQGISNGKKLLETTTKSLELVALLSSSDGSSNVHIKNNLEQIKELLVARKNIDSVIQRLLSSR